MDNRCEHFLLRKLSGLPTPATILTCVIQTQPALKSGSRRSATMRCRSIGYSGLVHSVHQSDQSFSGNRSGCLCKHATANLRQKLKSPKLSSWEDCSLSRSTANNQKCSESSSRSLSPCPLSYSNPCITSVYASHLLCARTRLQEKKIQEKDKKKTRKEKNCVAMAWLRARLSFSLLRSAIACLRSSRRKFNIDSEELHPALAVGQAGLPT